MSPCGIWHRCGAALLSVANPVACQQRELLAALPVALEQQSTFLAADASRAWAHPTQVNGPSRAGAEMTDTTGSPDVKAQELTNMVPDTEELANNLRRQGFVKP